jgi:dTDP-4-dehydrorhamnose reductase
LIVSPKVLVTGCRGQLGGDLMSYLGEDYEVVGCDVDDFDIRDAAAVKDAFDRIRPEIVLHTAAYTDVDGCEADCNNALSVNGEATGVIAQQCEVHGARMVYYSTDYVFDGDKDGPYIESDATNPQTVYGQSKLEGERLVAAHCENHLIMRIAWLYGRSGKNFVRTMIRRAHEQQNRAKSGEIIEPIKVVDDQAGNPTWTRDVARQTEKILQGNLTGVIHATATGETSWYGFACELFKLLDLPVQVKPCSSSEFPRPAQRPGSSSLENGRLSELGLSIMPDWRDSLRLFLQQHQTESRI